MTSILKRFLTLVTRGAILVALFSFAYPYFFTKKTTMTVAPVVALSHGGGEIDLPPITCLLIFIHHLLPFLNDIYLQQNYAPLSMTDK
jgi:hypothetical protein